MILNDISQRYNEIRADIRGLKEIKNGTFTTFVRKNFGAIQTRKLDIW